MNPKPFLAALTLCCALAAPAQAGDVAPPAGDPARAEFCKNNPVTCEVGEQKREGRKAWCDKNAEKCQALKDERKARRQKMKEACDANPKECEAKKAEMRKRIEDRRERREERQEHEKHHQEAAPATTPAK